MPSVRPQTAVRASRALAAPTNTVTTASPSLSAVPTSSTPSQSRCFSATRPRASGGGHGGDPPTGWLFGVKPGEKYQKEGWEMPFYIGFLGSFAVAAVAYAYKPDTSIQTWALEEARRRLEAEGILEDPEKKA